MHLSSRSSVSLVTRFWASLLILLLIQDPAVLLAEGALSSHKHAAHPAPLTAQERARHALNRLTFGPRPGDVERVSALGVRKWIELQLNPERIDDSALEAQLQNYPAMETPLRSLIEEFPSGAQIRNAADGRIPLPQDRVERAIYQNQIWDYEQRKQKQAQEAARQQTSPAPSGAQESAAVNPQMGGANPARSSSGNRQKVQVKDDGAADAMTLEDVARSPSIQVHEQKLYADLASTSIINLPADQRWNRLVSMKAEEFRGFMKSLTGEERLQLTEGMSPQQKEMVYALINPTLVVAGELLQTRLLTDIYSQRQLQAVMTDFWLNHFNVYAKKGPFAPWYLIDYERNAIEPNAMGKFEDLLVATAKSPAMLFYLDNQTSIGPNSLAATRARMNPRSKNQDLGLNENYARELMELHTLGVDGGYTQKDVTEVAKVFTGWTIGEPRQNPGFAFNERRHEPGPKYVLGRTIQENGEQEGLEVLHMLATSPATAHHLSQQLAVRFVSDNPPPALVNRMAKTYLKTGGDIRRVLRTMFNSPEFWSRQAYRAKVKTPEEFVISAVRATGGEVIRPVLLLNAINQLGMPFYGCATPNGYSWTEAAWVNTGDLLDRMNLSLALANHRMGTQIDLGALMKIHGQGAETIAQKEQALETALLNQPLAPPIRDAVLRQAGDATETAKIPRPAAKQTGSARESSDGADDRPAAADSRTGGQTSGDCRRSIARFAGVSKAINRHEGGATAVYSVFTIGVSREATLHAGVPSKNA